MMGAVGTVKVGVCGPQTDIASHQT